MREVASTALQVGAVAAIGGLAYKAYQSYQQGRPVVPQGVRDVLRSNFSAPGSGSDETPSYRHRIRPTRLRVSCSKR